MATNLGDVWDYIGGGTGKGQPIKVDPYRLFVLRRQREQDQKLINGVL